MHIANVCSANFADHALLDVSLFGRTMIGWNPRHEILNNGPRSAALNGSDLRPKHSLKSLKGSAGLVGHPGVGQTE